VPHATTNKLASHRLNWLQLIHLNRPVPCFRVQSSLVPFHLPIFSPIRQSRSCTVQNVFAISMSSVRVHVFLHMSTIFAQIRLLLTVLSGRGKPCQRGHKVDDTAELIMRDATWATSTSVYRVQCVK